MRVDVYLVSRGFFTSRNKAQEAIAAGLVSVRGGQSLRLVRQSNEQIDDNQHQEIVISASDQTRFVSRAGHKLDDILRQLNISVEGLCVLDVGISTGGFTDCLLQRGVRKVVGIDVGHDQLSSKIKNDPRVVSLEGLNARDPEQLSRLRSESPEQGFDMLVMDVSFISQTLIIPSVWPHLKPFGTWLSLVKPQFELVPEALSRGGLVKDAKSHEEACKRTSLCLQNQGARDIKILESPIEGKDGNREFFLYAKK